ncbi:secondary thiamine-phosphate synthase enzyme YjbQ [Fusibacter sp. JL298sf-3]
MFEVLNIKTRDKIKMYEILDEVKAFVSASGVLNGIVCLSVPHTTAGLTLNKNYDIVVQEDIINKMQELIPKEGNYKHIEGNSAAHVQASLFGNTATIILNEGHLELGMFQSIFLCEFDGPRKRKVLMKIVSG